MESVYRLIRLGSLVGMWRLWVYLISLPNNALI